MQIKIGLGNKKVLKPSIGQKSSYCFHPLTVKLFFLFQSVSFHENGRKHQQAVENRLYEIKKRGRKDEQKANLEEKWLQDIEKKAMNDYRKKDLGNNADITAQVFNSR